MDILAALSRIEEIERKASELYRMFHANFFSDKEAAYFFYKMHLEEKGHRNLVQYVKKLVRQNPKLFSSVDCGHFDFEAIEKKLDAELNRRKPRNLEEALDVAEEFEIVLGEGYLKSVPLQNNAILLDLCGALGDKDHTEKITAFKMKMKERGFQS